MVGRLNVRGKKLILLSLTYEFFKKCLITVLRKLRLTRIGKILLTRYLELKAIEQD